MGNENSLVFGEVLPRRMVPAMDLMRDALFHAKQTHSELWDHAIKLDQLLKLGLSHNDVRWLMKSGLTQHAIEVTSSTDIKRQFHLASNSQFSSCSCFAISAKGLSTVKEMDASGSERETVSQVRDGSSGSVNGFGDNKDTKPVWNPDTRELRFRSKLIKHFRWRAANQERLLTAFEEEDWPRLIDDPLPPTSKMDPKRRLHDTIKCLNRNHLNPLIRFHGDGTGEGVIWRQYGI